MRPEAYVATRAAQIIKGEGRAVAALSTRSEQMARFLDSPSRAIFIRMATLSRPASQRARQSQGSINGQKPEQKGNKQTRQSWHRQSLEPTANSQNQLEARARATGELEPLSDGESPRRKASSFGTVQGLTEVQFSRVAIGGIASLDKALQLSAHNQLAMYINTESSKVEAERQSGRARAAQPSQSRKARARAGESQPEAEPKQPPELEQRQSGRARSAAEAARAETEPRKRQQARAMAHLV